MTSEQSTPTLTSILEYIHLTLRYVASGFVAVGIYVFLYDPEITEFKDLSAFLVFMAAVIGIITYGLHFATLDKIFYGWSIIRYLEKNNSFLPVVLTEQIVDWQKTQGLADFENENILKGLDDFGIEGAEARDTIKRYILFSMANQTYLRIISKNELLVSLQNQVEKRLALLNFLYCSCYQIVVITLYFSITKPVDLSDLTSDDTIRVYILFLFAGLILYSAFRFNVRICGREMWLIENFPQKVSDIDLNNYAYKRADH